MIAPPSQAPCRSRGGERSMNAIIASAAVNVAMSASSWFTIPERTATIGCTETSSAARSCSGSRRNTCAASSHAK